MAGINKIDFSNADIMSPDKTKVETLEVGSTNVARITAQPGWIWDECIKLVLSTDSFQAHDLGILQSGQSKVTHEDGGEIFPRRTGGIAPDEGVAGKDSVRAMLMPGEFVMTTNAVKGMGNGNLDQGINNMYGMMRNLENRGRMMA